MLTLTPAGPFCARGGFHVDPWLPVPRAVVTHAHGDHARPGSEAYLAPAEGAALLRARLGPAATIETLEWGERRDVGGTRVSFHPAGHILGSAQVRLESQGDVWVVSGDYKRAPDPTTRPFELVPCRTFVTEATFALPVFRWDPAGDVMRDLAAWWETTAAQGRAAVLFCYVVGKAQRVLAALADLTDRVVLVHGALTAAIEAYAAAGVRMAPTKEVGHERRRDRFAGELVLAPLLARGSPWMRRFGNHSSAHVSGWMRVRGERRRRAYDRGFALSDHADWPALLDTIRATGASRVIATHGYVEPLARYLRDQGIDATAWRTSYEGEASE
jgi:putative mRNA 3-end processing factor